MREHNVNTFELVFRETKVSHCSVHKSYPFFPRWNLMDSRIAWLWCMPRLLSMHGVSGSMKQWSVRISSPLCFHIFLPFLHSFSRLTFALSLPFTPLRFEKWIFGHTFGCTSGHHSCLSSVHIIRRVLQPRSSLPHVRPFVGEFEKMTASRFLIWWTFSSGRTKTRSKKKSIWHLIFMHLGVSGSHILVFQCRFWTPLDIMVSNSNGNWERILTWKEKDWKQFKIRKVSPVFRGTLKGNFRPISEVERLLSENSPHSEPPGPFFAYANDVLNYCEKKKLLNRHSGLPEAKS